MSFQIKVQFWPFIRTCTGHYREEKQLPGFAYVEFKDLKLCSILITSLSNFGKIFPEKPAGTMSCLAIVTFLKCALIYRQKDLTTGNVWLLLMKHPIENILHQIVSF